MEGESCFDIFPLFFKSVFDNPFFFFQFHPGLLRSFYISLQLVFLWVAWLQLQRLVQSELVLVISK